jgi:hypothetical protein
MRQEPPQNPMFLLGEGLDVRFPSVSKSRRLGVRLLVVELGYPLLLALSTKELECLVADRAIRLQERLSTAMTWADDMLSLDQRLSWMYEPPGRHAPIRAVLGYRFYRPMLLRFLSWYGPLLTKSLVPLSEALADATERRLADVYGLSTLETGAVVVKEAAAYLDKEYWRRVVAGIGDGPDDPTPYVGMEMFLSGYAARIRGCQGTSAARTLLGDRVSQIAYILDGQWQERNAPDLRSLAEDRQKAEEDLGELNARALKSQLSSEEAWRAALATERTRGAVAAEPLYQDLVDDEEVGTKAQYRLGHLLLDAGDDTGLVHLRRVAFTDDEDELSLAAAYEACDYLFAAGRELEAAPFRSRWIQLSDLISPMHEERSQVRPRDRFLPHGLSSQVVERIRKELAEGPKLWRAYLVQKRVDIRPEQPAYVLGLMTEDCFIHRVNFEHLREAVRFAQVQIELPESCLITGLYHDEHTKIIRRMRRVKGARIL